MLPFALLILLSWLLQTNAYQTLSDDFLRNITVGGNEFDPVTGNLLSPFLIPRASGSRGNEAVQRHIIDFFTSDLPNWTLKWQNSTAVTHDGDSVGIANIIFRREPPWTKPGQANFLVLTAHYDSLRSSEGFPNVADGAVPCALLMYTARAIDTYMSQMHREMAALGEGGTEAMDMGIQVIFLDGSFVTDNPSEPTLYGAKALSKHWDEEHSLMGFGPNTLRQVRLLVALDMLGKARPAVPSYLLMTQWIHQNIANLEARFRELDLLETITNTSTFLATGEVRSAVVDIASDHTPFADRGVPFVHLLPDRRTISEHLVDDTTHLDQGIISDWAKIVAAFTLEWLDMMEVWPE